MLDMLDKEEAGRGIECQNHQVSGPRAARRERKREDDRVASRHKPWLARKGSACGLDPGRLRESCAGRRREECSPPATMPRLEHPKCKEGQSGCRPQGAQRKRIWRERAHSEQ